MWKTLLSSIGLGNITVDTIVEKKEYKPGEELCGKVEINGGMTDKKIEGIVITLLVKYEQDKLDSDFSFHEKHIRETEINNSKMIHSNETNTIPFSIRIPFDHPKSENGVETIIRTKLLVSQNIDPEDEDTIIIL
ncbi:MULTISPECIES: sporulation protein [Bacillus]|uniref:sporulation protein n=1 Tax=Bacillus TaxID=1386 RepID=UPI00031FE929|nr:MULTISPECIES: sporulation protein [Bacillus]